MSVRRSSCGLIFARGAHACWCTSLLRLGPSYHAATTKVIERPSDDPDGNVIGALYHNPSTPEYVLVELEERTAREFLAQVVDEGDGGYDGEADGYDDEADGYDDDDDAYERPSRVFRDDDSGELYYEYGDRSLPYHDGGVEYDGKFYDVMDVEGAETMYFDEDNGWLTDLP